MLVVGTIVLLRDGPGRIEGVEHMYRSGSGRREMRYKVRAEAADLVLRQVFVWANEAVPMPDTQVARLAELGSILCRARSIPRLKRSREPKPTRLNSRQLWYREARRRRWWRTRTAKRVGLKLRRWWRDEGKSTPLLALQ